MMNFLLKENTGDRARDRGQQTPNKTEHRHPSHPPAESDHILQRSLGNGYLQSLSQTGMPSGGVLIQRACACGGTCKSCMQQQDDRQTFQPKLVVGTPDDKYEQKADRVAEKVIGMSEPSLQRQEEEEEDKLLQTSPLLQQRVATDGGGRETSPIVREALQSASQPLDATTCTFKKSGFAYDFSQVQLHNAMSERSQSNLEINSPWNREKIPQLKQFVVGSPKDAYEIEADRVADKVTQQEPEKPDFQNHRTIKPIPIQRRSNRSEPETADLDLDKSGGQPLDRTLRHDMESRFGYTFRNVRIHKDARADQLSRSINARAFTFGNHIYFGKNQYNPNLREGKHLLAHELTHVVQQGFANVNHSSSEGSLQRQENEESNSADSDARKQFDEDQPLSEPIPIQRKVANNNSHTLFSLDQNVIQRNGACSPRRDQRGLMRGRLDKGTFPTKVRGSFRVADSNDHLSIGIAAQAKNWLLLWTSIGDVNFTATIDIRCRRVGSNCEISANQRPGSVFAEQDSPASGAIALKTEKRASNTVLAVTPHIGAAAGGGGSIGAGVGPASIGVSFPDSSQSRTISLGTWLWSCQS